MNFLMTGHKVRTLEKENKRIFVYVLPINYHNKLARRLPCELHTSYTSLTSTANSLSLLPKLAHKKFSLTLKNISLLQMCKFN